jgi:hypothetical protein
VTLSEAFTYFPPGRFSCLDQAISRFDSWSLSVTAMFRQQFAAARD